MSMKRYLSFLLALVLVVVMGITGCSSSPGGLTGNYSEDTLSVVNNLRTAIQLPEDAPNKAVAQSEAKAKINDFAARYQRDVSLSKLTSFTTMRTALNSLAAHYTAYPNRPIPEKLKQRLEYEFNQVESAIKRGS